MLVTGSHPKSSGWLDVWFTLSFHDIDEVLAGSTKLRRANPRDKAHLACV
jgi:hypothetical protein